VRQKLVEHADGVYRPAFTTEHAVRDQGQYQWSVRAARVRLYVVVDQHVCTFSCTKMQNLLVIVTDWVW